MATVQVIAPITGSSTVTSPSTLNYERVVFAASVLATTESVIVNVVLPDGVSVAVAPDVNGVYTGLTATNPVRTYFGGPEYQLVKASTAGACGVYLIPVGKGT
jgi:hypothetical protein